MDMESTGRRKSGIGYFKVMTKNMFVISVWMQSSFSFCERADGKFQNCFRRCSGSWRKACLSGMLKVGTGFMHSRPQIWKEGWQEYAVESLLLYEKDGRYICQRRWRMADKETVKQQRWWQAIYIP